MAEGGEVKLYVRQREIAVVGLVLLVASALRGYGLAWQALSGDEVFSVLVSALAETARPDEIVLLNLPDPAFTYYYHAPMPADVPPGEYGIEVGLYQVSTGKRLSLVGAPDAGADAVKLPVTVRVANP